MYEDVNQLTLEASQIGIIDTLSEEAFEIDTVREDHMVRMRLRAYLYVKEAEDEPVIVPANRWSWIRYGLSFYGPWWFQWLLNRVLPPARLNYRRAQASFPDTLREGFANVEKHVGPARFHWVDRSSLLYPDEHEEAP